MGGNTGAAVYWVVFSAVVSYVLWPTVHAKVNAVIAKHKDEIKEHITAEHERMHAALKAHITATLEGTKGDDPHRDT